MGESRTDNVARNVKFAIICQFIALSLSLVCRTVFVKNLNAEYLGISGLFTNIFTTLAFAELGIGDAIIVCLYKPIAYNEREKIKSLMQFYKKIYRAIGFTILLLGILCIPFLGKIIHGKPDIKENLVLIYLLFLFNVVISYFYTYKRSLITAYQRNYIVLIYQTVCIIMMNIAQMVVLLTFHNYIAYLVLQICGTIASNLVISRKADKEFPLLKEKDIQKIEKKEVRRIFSNVSAIVFYKFGTMVLTGTDNILISMLIGIKDVGICSNYLLIIQSIEAVLQKVKSAFEASVGNFNALESKERKEYVFNKIFFLVMWIYGFASLGLILSGNDLMYNWLGKDYVISKTTLLVIVINFFQLGVHSVAVIYRTTMGLFREGRLSPVVSAISNIALSVLLVKPFGLKGIFFATIISRFIGIGVVDPYLIYRRAFEKTSLIYHIMYLKYVAIFAVLYVLLETVFMFFEYSSWIVFICKVIVITIVYNGGMFLIFRKNQMFKQLSESIISYVKRKIFSG